MTSSTPYRPISRVNILASMATGPARNSRHGLWIRLLSLALLLMLASGCASQQSQLSDPEADPWEPFNRSIHSFNHGLDRAIVRPVATAYDKAMPDAPQRGLRNFFNNLDFPVTFLNLLLQGKVEESFNSIGRFVVNSTVGVLGFFDVASKEGMPDYDEDFGQTMAVWGWENSRYLVLPILGPSTVRDAGGQSFYGYTHPLSYARREHDLYWPIVLDLITLRAELLPFQADIDGANDPYIFIRDVYLQNRRYLIFDGNPPDIDYESLLEE